MSDAYRPPVNLDEGKVRKALGDSDTPGLVLFTIALSTFGPRVVGDSDEGVAQMDPTEMWEEFHARYGTWVTEEGENRLNALITGLSGGMFWRDEEVFMSVAVALFDGDMGDIINAGFESLNATEIMWAILEMELAWDGEETPEMSLNVQEFVERNLRDEQEDQVENSKEVEKSYLIMLRQMQEIGVPPAMIRVWDEEYADVMESLEGGGLT